MTMMMKNADDNFRDIQREENRATTTPTPTTTHCPKNANPDEPYYWETFETALPAPTTEQQFAAAASHEDNHGAAKDSASSSLTRWPRRRQRRGSSNCAAPKESSFQAAALSRPVEITFASHSSHGRPSSKLLLDDHILTTKNNDSATSSAAAATLLRRIQSTGDLPNSNSTNVLVVWHDDDNDDDTQGIAALCRSPSQSPLAVLLGNWNTSTNDNNNDDNASHASSSCTHEPQYFEPDDYNPWWWHESLVRHPPATVGVAVVALAAMLTHPVVFLAAALTAWGSVAAAHQGYHYYWNSNSNNNISNINNNHADTPITTTTTEPFSWDNALAPCFGMATTTTTTTDVTAMDAKNANPSHQEQKLSTKDKGKENALIITDTAASSLSPDDSDPTTAAGARSQSLPPPSPRGTTTTTSTQQQQQQQKDQQARQQQQDWLDQHYPPLKHTVVQNCGHLVGIHCVEFFHVFFDDEAVYGFKEFQRQRHDRNIVYGPWKDVVVVPQQQQQQAGVPAVDASNDNNDDGEDQDPAISMAPGGATRPSMAMGLAACGKYRLFRGRTLSFQAKTNSFLGPPYANTVKKQRMLIVSARLAILESRTRLSGIPFGDRFRVMERWIVTASKVDGRYVAQVASASCEVVFDPTALCPWEQQIKQKSATTIRDIVTAWCVMATEALQRTEQAKLSRRKKHNSVRSTMDHSTSRKKQEDDETTLEDDDETSSRQTSHTGSATMEVVPHGENNHPQPHNHRDDEEHHPSVEVVALPRNDNDAPPPVSDAPHHTFHLSAPAPSHRRSWLRRPGTTHSVDQ